MSLNEKNWVRFGGAGHEGEYCVHVAGCGIHNYIPRRISDRLEQLLPEWDISNRGTRIEIMSKKFFYGYRNDDVVIAAVESVIGEVEMHGERCNFALPMVQVLDEEHFEATGEVRFVKCAVLVDRPDHWKVKPVEAPYFDVRQFLHENTAFHMAWWQVSKTDGSAEPIEETFDVAPLHRLVVEQVRRELDAMNRALR